MQSIRSTMLLVDINAIKKNILSIKNYVGDKVMLLPVIKANAYGSYINKLPEITNMFEYVTVAMTSEALELLNANYKNKIIILNPPTICEIDSIIEKGFIFNGCDLEIIERVSKKSKNTKINIHVEIETGMGRTGVNINNLDYFLTSIKKFDNIYIDGVFTHLSSSTKDIEFSQKQISIFENALNIIKNHSITPKFIHFCNSGALLNFKNKTYNMVRIGLMMYGYYPCEDLKNKITVYPALILKSNINFIKKINIGDTVGYNKNFIADKETIVATVPFGFADGLIGMETGLPYVIVNGGKAKILGICMDNIMIDITNIQNICLNNEVFIWDNVNLTVEKVAEWCNGICNYEVISSLSDRIPRIFCNTN